MSLFDSLENIHSNLCLARTQHTYLKIRRGALCNIDAQGYKVDPSGNRVGKKKLEKSSLEEVFSYIQHAVDQALALGDNHSLELLQQVDGEVRFLQGRHSEKTNRTFSIKNLFLRIFQFPGLADYRHRIEATANEIHRTTTFFTKTLEYQTEMREASLKVEFNDLARSLAANETHFHLESFIKRVSNFIRDVRSHLAQFPDQEQTCLEKWRSEIQDRFEDAEMDSMEWNRLQIKVHLLNFIRDFIPDADFDENSVKKNYVEEQRDRTSPYRIRITNLLIKKLREPASFEKKSAEKCLYQLCNLFGPLNVKGFLFAAKDPSIAEKDWLEKIKPLLNLLGYYYFAGDDIDEEGWYCKHPKYDEFYKRNYKKSLKPSDLERVKIFYRYFLDVPLSKQFLFTEVSLSSIKEDLQAFVKGQFKAEHLKDLFIHLQDFPELRSAIAPILDAFIRGVQDPENVMEINLSGFGLTEVPDLTDFPKLTSLNLSHNRLHTLDSIPHDVFDKIEILDLSNNYFTEIPPIVLHLKKLESLNFNQNQMIVLPEDWGYYLPHCLQKLQLSWNQLTDISSLGELIALKKLYCNHNQIETFPEELLGLSVQIIDLQSNAISELPEMTDTSPLAASLTIFDCRENKLTSLPDSWGVLSSIEELQLAKNQINYLPQRLASDQVKLMDLSFNVLRDVPSYYICLPREARLEGNFMKSLPDLSSEEVKNTQMLNLSFCELAEVPSFASFPHLTTLILSGNPLTTLPNQLVSSAIQLLDLQNTRINPEELKKLEPVLTRAAAERKTSISIKDQNRLKELSKAKHLYPRELQELKVLKNKLLTPALLIDDSTSISKGLRLFYENGRQLFGYKESPIQEDSNQGLAWHLCETTGNRAYQQNGQVVAAIPCPPLNKDDITDAIIEMALYFDAQLKNPRIRYRGETITASATTAFAVLYGDHFYLLNIGNSLAILMQNQSIQAALEGYLDEDTDLEIIHSKDRESALGANFLEDLKKDESQHNCIELNAEDYPLVLLGSAAVWDVLAPPMVQKLICETIVSSGNTYEERLARLPKTLAQANRLIRNQALSIGLDGTLEYDNIAPVILLNTKAFRPDKEKQTDTTLHFAAVYDGHNENGSEAFTRYLVDRTPTVFKNCLNKLVKKIEPKLSNFKIVVTSLLDKKIIGCALVIMLGAIFIPTEFAFSASIVAVGGAILLISAIVFKIIYHSQLRSSI